MALSLTDQSTRVARTSFVIAFSMAVGSWLVACDPPMTGDPDASTTCDRLGCADDEAPLRPGDGGVACTRVGANRSSGTAPWPDIAGLPAPLIFVRAGASGGDGSMAQPLGDLAAAVRDHSDASSFVLAAGHYAIAATLAFPRSVFVVGSGTDATIIDAADGLPAMQVTGAALTLTLRRIGIAYAHPSAGAFATFASDGATLDLGDVAIDGAWEGVRATSAAILANGLTVRRSGQRGIALLREGTSGAASTATLTNVLVRDGAGVGLLADRAVTHIARGLFVGNAGDGIAVLGGPSGSASDIVDTAVLCNIGTGVRVQQTDGVVNGARWTVAGTRAHPGTAEGDGVFVGAGGSLTLDPPPPGGWGVDTEGMISLVRDNARTGFLVSGDPSQPALAAGRADLYGARIAANHGPGVFVQENATIGTLGYAIVENNRALGVGVTSGASITGLLCDLIRSTEMAVLDTTHGSVSLGDGLSMANSGAVAMLLANHFDDNARFGAVFSSASAVLMRNTGSGNGFGLGTYNAATLTDDGSNSINAAAPPPAMATVATDSVAGP